MALELLGGQQLRLQPNPIFCIER